MKNTIQTTLTMETQPESIQKTCQTLSYSLEDFLAKLSVLQENEKDLTIQGVRSFLRLQGFCRTKDPHIFYSKMLKVYCLTTKEKLSKSYLGFSPNWGIMLNGRYLILPISECHREESECSLKDILEKDDEEKYYINENTMRNILLQE